MSASSRSPHGVRPVVPDHTLRRAEAFLRGETRGWRWSALRLALTPPAMAFSGFMRLRSLAYRRGWLSSFKSPLPVISVGNLSAGGTGKTPFIRYLAARLRERGLRPVILSRGYGSRPPGALLDEEGASLERDLGDVRVLQGKKRSAIARRLAETGDRSAVLILDDAMQHLGLRRDLEIILVDATSPFGSGWTFPAGILREPPSALRRGNLILVTHPDDVSPDDLLALQKRLAKVAPDALLGTARHVPTRLLPEGRWPEDLLGEGVFLVSGIARPETFERSVRRAGVNVLGRHNFPDHFAYSEAECRAVSEAAKAAGADIVLATGKDEPKLAPLISGSEVPWRFLEVEVRPDEETEVHLEELIETMLARTERQPS